jgi:hypothetical protein
MSRRRITTAKQLERIRNVSPRNWLVPLMVENTKGGPMKDRKKENSKKRCRRPINGSEIHIHGAQ